MAVFCLCTLYLEGHAKLCYCDDWKIDHFASLMSLETKKICIKSVTNIFMNAICTSFMPIAEFLTSIILDSKGENNPEFHRATVG